MAKRLALLIAMFMVIAACGTDAADGTDAGATETTSNETPTDEEMVDEEAMDDEEMSDEEMVDEEAMDDEEMSDEEMADLGDVVDVAAAESDLTTFMLALEAAGILEDLRGDGPFTIFAPSDEAFEAYLAEAGMTVDEAFGDMEMLGTILENHIVAANDDSAMVMNMAGTPFISLSGLELDVTVDGDTVMVNTATVIRYDLQASNGFIHVIDQVLAGS